MPKKAAPRKATLLSFPFVHSAVFSRKLNPRWPAAMRLLNCLTLESKEFFDDGNTPVYIILSHRWSDDEVSYKDFRKGRGKNSLGYRKIVEFCAFASQRPTPWPHNGRVQWVWVDTCCIDKRSSAELSEAIK